MVDIVEQANDDVSRQNSVNDPQGLPIGRRYRDFFDRTIGLRREPGRCVGSATGIISSPRLKLTQPGQPPRQCSGKPSKTPHCPSCVRQNCDENCNHAPSTPTNGKIRVLEFAFTGYPVTDMARARQFYEEVLGLKKSMALEDSEHAWIEYDLGGHTLAINNGTPQWKPGSDGPALALEVEDFDATVAALRKRGVCFTVEPLDVPTCRLTVILDPDRNSLAIHQRRTPR